MQLFVHIPMLGVHLPSDSEDLIENLVNIATLDLLPTDLIYEEIFDDLPEEIDPSKGETEAQISLLTRLGSSGYESSHFV
mmetsp:Transcript_34403/g.45281  ORF Transcript_34403/g.45281 Transcript_34403/m.45281 type:complete len:80 (-) Transcript_34403:1447-1686(-)